MLSTSDKSARSVHRRLRELGFSEHSAGYAVEYCVSSGYLDERRQLARLVSVEANTALRGPRYICAKLTAKGYRRADVEAVIEELVEAGEVDFKDNLERLYEKKGVTDREERRALAYKYGYRGTDD